MSHNTATTFPTEIDQRRFFSDVRLSHANIMNAYKDLISAEDYVGASQYLYDAVEGGNVNMDYNGAYVWNTMENRIVAIENYLRGSDSTSARPYISDTEPTTKWAGMSWIGE